MWLKKKHLFLQQDILFKRLIAFDQMQEKKTNTELETSYFLTQNLLSILQNYLLLLNSVSFRFKILPKNCLLIYRKISGHSSALLSCQLKLQRSFPKESCYENCYIGYSKKFFLLTIKRWNYDKTDSSKKSSIWFECYWTSNHLHCSKQTTTGNVWIF